MAAAEDIPQELSFVDLETTGGNAAYDRITEVGIVRVRNGEFLDEWSSLVNPECPIPSYIESFTGITNDMVADAPRFADIAAEVQSRLRGAVFVAHNARFDYSFLRSEFLKADVNFSASVLCTVKLSRRLFPEFARHNLDAVMERNGLICNARHRALGDAKVLHDLWFKLCREVPEPRLAAAVQSLLGAGKLPAHLPPGLADDLPEGPGAYRFFGEDDTLLYVGRGGSLRTRVCSHFTADDAGSKDRRLQDRVRRVDWVETAGELGSMLREARWIKEGKPLHNRRPKAKADAHTLRSGPDGVPPDQRCAVEAVAVDAVDHKDLLQCFGIFHSEKDARKALLDIARAQQLCLKALGLEDAAGSCLAYQVGKCRGACAGKEPLVLHRMRLMLALSSLKLKAWPFPGRIALRERDPRSGAPEFTRGAGWHGAQWQGTEWHVLDHWTYLGTARTDEDLAAMSVKDAGEPFDVDVYKILVRYFANHPRLEWRDLSDRTVCT